MRILVTGASGFIGKNFLLHSRFRQEQIDATYLKDTTFIDFINHNKINVKPIQCDLTSFEDVKDKLTDNGKLRYYDVCLYLAANSDPRYSVNHPADDVKRNVFALINVLMNIKCKKFIFISSGAVYHKLKGLVSPKSNLDPGLPYSISKLTCENYIKFFQSNGNIVNYTIVRFFGAFGPFEPERKITTKLVKQVVMNGSKEFTIYGSGKNLIDLMYVEDTIDGIDSIISTDTKNITIDFGSGKPISIIELIKRTSKFINKRIKVNKQGKSDENIGFRISSKDFCKIYNFKFKVSYEEGLNKLINHLAKSEK